MIIVRRTMPFECTGTLVLSASDVARVVGVIYPDSYVAVDAVELEPGYDTVIDVCLLGQ